MSQDDKPSQDAGPVCPIVHVASSPHLQDTRLTTQRMMIDVLIGLSPAVLASLVFYSYWAALQLALCIGGCVVTEAIFTLARKRPLALWDLSAVLTGVIGCGE